MPKKNDPAKPVVDALRRVLCCYPDEEIIDTLKADRGLGYRRYPGDPIRDSELVALHKVLRDYEHS